MLTNAARDSKAARRPLRIAYVTTYDPRDVKGWSGLGFFILDSLTRRGVEVELIHSLHKPWALVQMARWKTHFYAKLRKRTYSRYNDRIVAWVFAREVARRLAALPPVDAVLCPGTLAVAFLPGDLPLVTYSDATARSLLDLYPDYNKTCRENLRDAEVIDARAYRRAAAVVFSSEWAGASARHDFQVDAAKIHLVPFGANLQAPPARDAVERAIQSRGSQCLRLLFLGVDWGRKGGPFAVEVVRCLIGMGVPAQLCVIGCEPALKDSEKAFVTVRGFLGKATGGEVEMAKELAASHFLLLPSMADCTPVVYCEASAFGVPCIARKVGGVASVVRDGRNGLLFDLEATTAMVALKIAQYFTDYPAYRKLAQSTRMEYESHLNWDVAGESLERIIQTVVGNHQGVGASNAVA